MKDTNKKILQDHVQMHEYDVEPLDIWSGIEKKQNKKRTGVLIHNTLHKT